MALLHPLFCVPGRIFTLQFYFTALRGLIQKREALRSEPVEVGMKEGKGWQLCRGQPSEPAARVAQSSAPPWAVLGCGRLWPPPSLSLWQAALRNRSYRETKSKQPGLSPGPRPGGAATLRWSVGLWARAGSWGPQGRTGRYTCCWCPDCWGRLRSDGTVLLLPVSCHPAWSAEQPE